MTDVRGNIRIDYCPHDSAVWIGQVPWSVCQVRLEQTPSPDVMRLVVELPTNTAAMLNAQPGMQLPVYPCEPAVSQQLASAARAMASAAVEMTLTLRAAREGKGA